jgi:lipoprotein-releasing system permease protein
LQGVILKGIGPDFEWGFLKDRLVSGAPIVLSDSIISMEIIISDRIARKLLLGVGDEVRMYFLSGSEAQPRGRKFEVQGIYETGLEEFDDVFVIGDIRNIQRLNNWSEDEVSGFEVFIDDFQDLDEMSEFVYQSIGYDLNTETITESYPQIFDWLRLMDINVVIILILMIMVSGITIISTLLIMIIERTGMIGVLKSLGIRNQGLRELFLYLTARIVLRGMLWGNLAGIGIIVLQYYFKIIPLKEESYYIDYVPVSLNFVNILLVNGLTFVLCVILVLIPGYIIGRITPVRAIRYE